MNDAIYNYGQGGKMNHKFFIPTLISQLQLEVRLGKS